MASNLEGLLNTFSGQAQHGPGAAYYAQGDYDNAVEAYKKTGASGVSDLGPAIDESTGDRSADTTQQAWALNGQLAKINSGAFNGTAATQSDADNAAAIVVQMLKLYQQAYSGAVTSAASDSTKTNTKPYSPGAPTPVATSSASTSSDPTPLIGGALIGAAVVGVVLGTLPAAIGGAIAGAALGSLLRKKGA